MDRGRKSAEVEIGRGFGVEEIDVDGAPVGGCHCGSGGVGYEGWVVKRASRVATEGKEVVDRSGSWEWTMNWPLGELGGTVMPPEGRIKVWPR